jgi:hypothetical protein
MKRPKFKWLTVNVWDTGDTYEVELLENHLNTPPRPDYAKDGRAFIVASQVMRVPTRKEKRK